MAAATMLAVSALQLASEVNKDLGGKDMWPH